jgi:hypothetical protein
MGPAIAPNMVKGARWPQYAGMVEQRPVEAVHGRQRELEHDGHVLWQRVELLVETFEQHGQARGSVQTSGRAGWA